MELTQKNLVQARRDLANAREEARREAEKYYESEMKKLQNDNRTLRDAVANAEEKYKNDLKKAIAKAEQEAAANAEKKYKDEIENLQDENRKLNAKILIGGGNKDLDKKIKDLEQRFEKSQNENTDLSIENKRLKKRIEELTNTPQTGSDTTGVGTGKPPKPIGGGMSPTRRLEIKTRIERQIESLDKEVEEQGASWRSLIIKSMAPTLKNLPNPEERKYVHDLYKAHLEQKRNFSSMYIFTENCTKLLNQ